MSELLTIRKRIEARMNDAKRQLERTNGDHTLIALVGTGDELRRAWASLNLTRQAAIVKAVMDHAVIAPGDPGSRTMDPQRVEPYWRL